MLLHWLQRVVRYFLLIEIEREGGYTQVPLVQTNALYYRTLYLYLKHSNLHLRVTHSPSVFLVQMMFCLGCAGFTRSVAAFAIP